MEKITTEEVNEMNRKILILLKSVSDNRLIRALCYIGSINFVIGIVLYFIFRRANSSFAKRCLLISAIFTIMILVFIVINIFL